MRRYENLDAMSIRYCRISRRRYDVDISNESRQSLTVRGDGAGNTVEENSDIFCLIRMR